MTKSVKRRGPLQLLDDEVFAKLERELGLASPDETLRHSLSDLVFDYISFCQLEPPGKAAVGKRLHAIKMAARELHKKLNENPIEAAARDTMSWNRLMEKNRLNGGGNNWCGHWNAEGKRMARARACKGFGSP